MKNLLVICGDYRTFDITVKTFAPLLNSNVDVHIDIWDESSSYNEPLNINYKQTIDLLSVFHTIAPYQNGAEVFVNVESLAEHQLNYPQTHNLEKLLFRNSSVYNTVMRSGKQYNDVIVCRPDTFFDIADARWPDPDDIKNNEIKISVPMNNNDGKMSDTLYVMKFDTYRRAFKNFNYQYYMESGLYKLDWHIWIYTFFTTQCRVGLAEMFCRSTVGRPGITHNDTYDMVIDKSNDWWLSNAWNSVKLIGYEATLFYWPSDFIDRALAKFGPVPDQVHQEINNSICN
jgi:hypothetical protein